MAISDIIKNLYGGKRDKPETPSASFQKQLGKEKEEDPSVFAGKPFLRRTELRQWLRRPDLYETTRIPRKERLELGERLFRRDYIRPREVKKREKELERALRSARTIKERGERRRELRLIKSFLGKRG